MKIVEYITISGNSKEMKKFEDRVNSKIQEGYQPYGNLTSSAAHNEVHGLNATVFIVQPMVKFEET